MLDLPTFVYPFIFAVIAAVAGRVLGGSRSDEPESLPRLILYALAGACVVIGLAALWLQRNG